MRWRTAAESRILGFNVYRMRAGRLEQVNRSMIRARGGSKGIRRKNLAPLGGRPLIAHTCDAARGSRALTRVIVSTDDDEVAAEAMKLVSQANRYADGSLPRGSSGGSNSDVPQRRRD